MRIGILVRDGQIVAEVPIIRGTPYQSPIVPDVRRSWFYGMSTCQIESLKLMIALVFTALIACVIKVGSTL